MTSRRQLFPGAFWHVTDSATRDEPLFVHPPDRGFYLELLAEAVELTGLEILHFCLMTNHTHLVVRDPHALLSDALWHVKTAFARRRRYVHREAGTTFARRFHRTPILDASHLPNVMVYLSDNPVKAGLSADRVGYRWSAHRALIGDVVAPPGLALETAHDLLGGRAACLDLLTDPSRQGSLPPAPAGGRPRRTNHEQIRLAKERDGLSHREAADRFGVSISTIRRAMSQRS